MAYEWSDEERTLLFLYTFIGSVAAVSLYGYLFTRVKFAIFVPVMYGVFAFSFLGYYIAMSSILHMVTGVTADETNPCGKSVPIYDGKRRFDFVLKFKSETNLTSNDPQGYVGPGYHCQVQYKEVAGFRKRDPREKPYPWIDLYMGSLRFEYSR